jgi:hypothetical protein
MPRTLSSAGALAALLAVYLLAFLPAARPTPADTLTLLFLAVCGSVALIPTLRRRLLADADAATFGLIAVAYVLYQLADRSGPAEGFALRFPFLPDDRFVISYAMRAVLLGAVLGAPMWLKSGGPERYMVAALGILGILGAGIFKVLSLYFKVGVVETLDPTPMVTLYIQIVGYAALALCCRAVTLHERLRAVIFLALPAALFALWARHTFMPAPQEAAE